MLPGVSASGRAHVARETHELLHALGQRAGTEDHFHPLGQTPRHELNGGDALEVGEDGLAAGVHELDGVGGADAPGAGGGQRQVYFQVLLEV